MSVLAEVDSAVRAEHEVSSALGVAYSNTDWPRTDAVTALAEDLLLGATTDAGRPGSAELLAALASVAPDEVAEKARELAGDVPPDATPVADWITDIGSWVCEETFRLVDDYGDSEHWGAVFTTPSGADRHAFLWLIDNTENGYLEDIIFDPEAEHLLEQLPAMLEEHDVRKMPADPAELHAVVADAMRLTDSTVELPEEEDYGLHRALTISRLRRLPAPQRRELADSDERDEVIEAFIASPQAQALLHPADGEAPDEDTVRFVSRLALDHAVDYTGGEPLRVTPLTVTVFMTEWVPRKAMLDPEDVAWLPDVLRAWIGYAFEQTGRPEAIRDEALEAVSDLTPEFGRMIGTGEGRGFAGQLLAGFLDEGVDITDSDQLAAAIERYNESLGRP
jgi:hypothetical protein